MQFRRVVEPNSLQRIGFGVVASNLSLCVEVVATVGALFAIDVLVYCFGDHILCCGEFTTRHEAIVSQLTTHFLQAAGLAVQNNVGVGGRGR